MAWIINHVFVEVMYLFPLLFSVLHPLSHGQKLALRHRRGSCRIEHLLQALPPRWRAGQTALRAFDERLLVAVGHPPPLLDLGILRHLLHVACPIVADVLEGGEEDVAIRIIKDGV